jgi:hypothetical protein
MKKLSIVIIMAALAASLPAKEKAIPVDMLNTALEDNQHPAVMCGAWTLISAFKMVAKENEELAITPCETDKEMVYITLLPGGEAAVVDRESSENKNNRPALWRIDTIGGNLFLTLDFGKKYVRMALNRINKNTFIMTARLGKLGDMKAAAAGILMRDD